MNRTLSRVCVAGLWLIGAILVLAMFKEKFALAVFLMAVPGVLYLVGGSPLRVLSMLFGLQIILTITQLTTASMYIGFMSVRADDIVALWFLWLWLLSIPDGSMKRVRPGPSGFWIACLLALLALAAHRGFTVGNNPDFIGQQIKTFGGYVFYFPLLWILSQERSREVLWKVLVSSAAIGGLVFMLKGLTGTGEGVYYRDETGLRIGTRQPNAIGAVMLVMLGRLWKDWKHRPPLLLAIPAILVMGGALILSQTRGLWGGVLLALAAAWVLNLFRKDPGVRLGRKMIISITILAVMVGLVVMTVSVLGIVSASEIAERTGNESGNYLTDKSVMSRLLSWVAVIDRLGGPHALLGRGLGETITYFKPEVSEIRTMFFVDNSYFQTALVMGVTGVLVLMGLFFSALFRSARLFLRTKCNERAGTALGIFCALIMLMFASGFASPITNYRFTILWAFILALLQTEILLDRRPLPDLTAEEPLEVPEVLS